MITPATIAAGFQFSWSLIATSDSGDFPAKQGELSILLESYCNISLNFIHSTNLSTFNSLGVLLQLYMPSSLAEELRPFNSLGVLLQPRSRTDEALWGRRFQFSWSLIATSSGSALGGILMYAFNSLGVLLQLQIKITVDKKKPDLSILLESYCNVRRSGSAWTAMTSLSILLESYCNQGAKLRTTDYLATFNSLGVLLQLGGRGRIGHKTDDFQFSWSLIATCCSGPQRRSRARSSFQFSWSLIATGTTRRNSINSSSFQFSWSLIATMFV